MDTRPTLKATLTTGTILLSGVFLFAQAASTTPSNKSIQPTAPTAEVTSQPGNTPTTVAAKDTGSVTPGNQAAQQKKHLAGVKYEDRTVAPAGTLDHKQANDKKTATVDSLNTK